MGAKGVIQLDDAVRSALDGDAILFVGAGLSFLSRNASNENLPDGLALIDLLLNQPPKTGSKHPLDRVAGHAIRTRGVDFVYDLLKRSLTVSSIDDRLAALYNLPWRRIYTTNYDDAIETALRGKRPISSVNMNDDISRSRAGAIIHLNGYIGDVVPSNIQTGLVLTDQSYAISKLQNSEWFKYFIRDLRSARSIFFVGYSLADLDIQRALISDEAFSRKTFFYISPKADELEISSIAEYGTIVAGGIESLFETHKRISSDYEQVRFSPAFLSLTEITPKPLHEDNFTNVQKLTNQLVYGQLPENEVLHRSYVFGSQHFLVLRKQDKAVIDALKRGPWRDVVYIGELASGKSSSALNIATHLLDEGYRVFYAEKGSTLSNELRIIASKSEKIVVVFEKYASMMDEIREYLSIRNQQHRIIITERSVTHELISDFIDKTPHLGPIFEASLDRIEPADVPAFEALVNFGGFWGDRSGASEVARQRLITNQLDSSLYRLLIEIIKSKKVQDEIKGLLTPIMGDRKALKLFVSSFIVNALGFRFTLNDWQSIFDGQWVRQVMRTYADQVRHFLSFQGDTIFPRAGLLSAHILQTIANEEIIRESLVDLYERASRNADFDPEFVSLRIALTKYGSIEPIFPSKQKANNIFRYYDDIRIYGETRNNSDYWLQVGIAATIYDDLQRAAKAFENAYSRERSKRNPNLKKIDNYFSRFEMRMSIEQNDAAEAFSIFSRANERLKKQMFLEENRHYPYKTGRYYADIAAKHFKNWTEGQQKQFIREAKDIRERAISWKNSNREFSADVEILIRETSAMLAKFESD